MVSIRSKKHQKNLKRFEDINERVKKNKDATLSDFHKLNAATDKLAVSYNKATRAALRDIGVPRKRMKELRTVIARDGRVIRYAPYIEYDRLSKELTNIYSKNFDLIKKYALTEPNYRIKKSKYNYADNIKDEVRAIKIMDQAISKVIEKEKRRKEKQS